MESLMAILKFLWWINFRKLVCIRENLNCEYSSVAGLRMAHYMVVKIKTTKILQSQPFHDFVKQNPHENFTVYNNVHAELQGICAEQLHNTNVISDLVIP